MATDTDLLALVGGDAAWLARVKRALGWNEKLAGDATADQIAARLYKALDHLREFEEEKHGIDPTTGADTPAKLIAQIETERTAKEAAEAAVDVERIAKEAAEAEVVRLTAELKVRPVEPIAVIER